MQNHRHHERRHIQASDLIKAGQRHYPELFDPRRKRVIGSVMDSAIYKAACDTICYIISDAEEFAYFGTAIAGNSNEGVPIYKIVDDIVEKSDESYGYISSTQAGEFFNDEEFNRFLKEVFDDPNITGDNFNTIYNGTNGSGIIELSDKTTVQSV